MNVCGDCMYFDRSVSDGKTIFTHYMCRAFRCWRRENQGACGQFTHSGGCYLTTACVSRKGLADDCKELTVLRQYRDSYLKSRSDGEALIRAYYETAPYLVEQISLRDDAAEIYDHIYVYICECVRLIEEEKHQQALDRYRDMVKYVTELINTPFSV